MNARQIVYILMEALPGEIDPVSAKSAIMQTVPFRTKKLSRAELEQLIAENKYLDENVAVELWDLIGNDIEWLNDHVSEVLTGSTGGLMDIGYSPVGVHGGEVIINVVADASESLEYYED